MLLHIEARTLYSNCSDGSVRVVGGSADYEGRVEICINRVWGTICWHSDIYHNPWVMGNPKVICRQLGHLELGISR